MKLVPRFEKKDFRDIERRQQSKGTTGWDRVKSGLNVVATGAFIALTAYNVFIIGSWLSDWYARRRAQKMGPYKRSHARRWNFEEGFVRSGRVGDVVGVTAGG
jgi:hypothetical protein